MVYKNHATEDVNSLQKTLYYLPTTLVITCLKMISQRRALLKGCNGEIYGCNLIYHLIGNLINVKLRGKTYTYRLTNFIGSISLTFQKHIFQRKVTKKKFNHNFRGYYNVNNFLIKTLIVASFLYINLNNFCLKHFFI